MEGAVVKETLDSTATIDYEALMSDGGVVHIRSVQPHDIEALRSLHERVSDDTIYRRFFQANRKVALQYVDRLLRQPDSDDHAALVALVGDLLVAVAAFERAGPHEAEVALLVDDAYHRRGIGTLLLEELCTLARSRGVHRLLADILATNALMLEVADDTRLVSERTSKDGVVDIALDTAPTEAALQSADERERVAEEGSLKRVFAPRTVAVIGAGRRPGGIGHEILRNINEGGFTGSAFAVNPHAGAVAGVLSYPNIGAVPGHVDLAVIAVPARQVPAVVADCARAGVHGAVVVTSGLAEVGGEGVALQRQAVLDARRSGMRIVGPNCLGIANTDPEIRLNATFAPVQPLPGALALASQSGAVGIAILDEANRSGIGLSEFVSLGNKSDVSGNDLLLYWWRHPKTRAIALYLESLGNPRKFARLARQVGREKPVLVVKSGRSPAGLRAGASHTAAAASSETVVNALFAQSGVIRLDTIGELLDVARVLVDQPLPAGKRVGIVGNAGGAGVLAADSAAAVGLDVPQLSHETHETLRVLLPDAPGLGNPIDLGAGASPESLRRAVEALAGSSEVDSIVVVLTATRANSAEAALAAIETALQSRRLPAVVSLLGAPDMEDRQSSRLPRFALPEPAVRALGRIAAYAQWRRTPEGTVPPLSGTDTDSARALAATLVEDRAKDGWLDASNAARLLGEVGVGLLPGEIVRSRAEALAAAKQLGYPVVVKAADPQLVHKTDLGAVRIDVAAEPDLLDAYDGVSSAVRAAGYDPAVLVQPFRSGVEMAIGVVHEPPFGPVLMLAAGGVLIDVLDDRAWRTLPLTDTDAVDMLQSLRSARLLDGYRGSPAVDRGALIDLLHRVGQLADAVPEIAELDLNPVIVTSTGAFVVDAKIRVAPPVPEPDPYSRRLR
jgi:acyl-CoA synthetase (NDP forming)/GNAT superfamily N-acetyltransferase